MKKIITTALALSSVIIYAQYNGKIGINTDQPKATLDLNIAETNKNQNTNEGILIPRLTKSRLAQIDDDYLLEGTLVYIKEVDTPTTANAKVNNVLANGFHYYDGVVWQPIQKTTLPVATVSPKFDYVLSADGSVLMQWMNKYTENVDMNTYADMADVKVISQYLLNGSKVKSFTIRNGVTTVGQYAFADNPNMEINFIDSIITIENNAFQNNQKISQVHLPNLTKIGEYAFNNNTALTSVSLPQATTIGLAAFIGNTALTSVSLPQATTIGSGAFRYNTALTSVSLPQATTIGDYAFYGNAALMSVRISSSIKAIGYQAFNGIAPNAVIVIESTTPPELLPNDERRYGVFDTTCTIKVPMASVNAYKTAPIWERYANQIEGY